VSSTNNPETNGEPAAPAPLWLTWAFVETYRHPVPLDAVAAATGRTVNELAADPASLLGVVGNRLGDLLTGYQSPVRIVGAPEVEIVGADYYASPTLAELVDAGRTALQADCDAHPDSAAGRALAALLAGLRREGITDR
jgi:hypothetical protein